MNEEVRYYGTLKEVTVTNNGGWPYLIWLFEVDEQGRRQGMARCYEMLERMYRHTIGIVFFQDDVVTGRVYYGHYRPILHQETLYLLSISGASNTPPLLQ